MALPLIFMLPITSRYYAKCMEEFHEVSSIQPLQQNGADTIAPKKGVCKIYIQLSTNFHWLHC